MKIISYTIFGNEEYYRNGLVENLKIGKTIFPEFIFRVYACENLPNKFIKTLEKLNAEVILKKTKYPFEGLYWRFLPMQEDHEVVLSKDCDTRITKRERWVYDDFYKSDKNYHTIRDTPGSRNTLLGGCWGIKYKFKS